MKDPEPPFGPDSPLSPEPRRPVDDDLLRAIQPPEEESLEEMFADIEAFVEGPFVKQSAVLARRGYHFAPPDEIGDDAIGRELTRFIHALAECRVVLDFTNHLDDRELYQLLWSRLDDEVADLSHARSGCSHMECYPDYDSPEHLQYYADDDEREDWQEENPGKPLPERLPFKSDRDARIPKNEDLEPPME